MFIVSNKIKWPQAIRMLVASLLFCVGMNCEMPAQSLPAGRIVGNLDGLSADGDHFFISGWACQQVQKDSILVHVYDGSKNTMITAQWANLQNDPAVANACRDRGEGKHRFMAMLPYGYGPDSKIDVHGIRR